jgi:3-oxoacyl-[acyl-carrier protein] reductase
MKTLEGKIAIVTGGGRGIGAAISKKLAEQGATVIATYSKSADATKQVVTKITSTGGKAEALQADQSNMSEVRKLIDTIGKKYGKIDILVNNAGIFEGALVQDVTEEMYDRTMNINVKSLFVAIAEAVKFMPEGGRIVNIGSVLGERSLFPGLSVYNTSKFAVAGLTRSAARDLAEKKITVNCVQPGSTETEMNPVQEGQLARIPLGTYGKPEDIAEAVAYFASPAAKQVTGAVLTVDGGANA